MDRRFTRAYDSILRFKVWHTPTPHPPHHESDMNILDEPTPYLLDLSKLNFTESWLDVYRSCVCVSKKDFLGSRQKK